MGHKYVKEEETFNTSRNGTVPKPTAEDISAGKVLGAGGSWVTGGGGGGGAVNSVNGQIGDVVLDAEDVGALPDTTPLFSGSYNDLRDKPTIPAAQVNTDWNADSGVAKLLNKPILGTASAKDVPESGNASDTEVVMGSDTRLGKVFGNNAVVSTDKSLYLNRQCLTVSGASSFTRDKIIGYSVVWNQLVDTNTASVTIPNGRKYVLFHDGEWTINQSDGTAISVVGGSDMLTDLTQMFNAPLADYFYGLGSTDGMNALRELGFFTKQYSYSANTIIHVKVEGHKIKGKNLVEYTEAAVYRTNTGEKISSTVYAATNKIDIVGGKKYTFSASGSFGGATLALFWCDDDYVGGGEVTVTNKSFTFTAPINVNKMIVESGGGAGNLTPSAWGNVQLELGEEVTEFEPYNSLFVSYDATKEFCGNILYKDNQITFKGDSYSSDGQIERTYKAINLGNLNYTYDSGVFYSRDVVDEKQTDGISCVCECYEAVENVNTAGLVTKDKTICLFKTPSSTHRVYIKDTDYTNANTLKTALSGKYLEYELASSTMDIGNPFTDPQTVKDATFEEYVDGRTVPLPPGHETQYLGSSEDIVEALPDPGYDGKRVYMAVTKGGITRCLWQRASAAQHIYSTTEQVVGEWIDGNIVYEITANMGSVSAGSQKILDLTSLNIGIVIDIRGIGKDSNNNYNPIPQAHSNSNNYQAFCRYNNDKTLGVYTGSGISFSSCYVTIQYTKTS